MGTGTEFSDHYHRIFLTNRVQGDGEGLTSLRSLLRWKSVGQKLLKGRSNYIWWEDVNSGRQEEILFAGKQD